MRLKGKRVLVTGACGFIGSHLVERLVAEGCDVRAFVFYNSFNSWGWLDTLPKKTLKSLDIFTGDIRDPNGVKTAMKDIDIVFHLAALIGIPFSYHSPDSYIDTNVKGTLNVLQAARDSRVKRVIVTSTSEVYGTAIKTPIDEKHPLQGQSPYSASKIGADKIAESFYLSFGLPVVIVRPFNTFGPRQSARAVIPTIISQVLAGQKNIRLGSLSPTRDMNYVSDTCDGFVRIARTDGIEGETINICSGREISIGDLAEKILRILKSDARIVKDSKRVRPDNSEVDRLLGCNKALKRLTGWRSRHSLDEGLRNTVEWFSSKDNLKSYKHGIYNV